MVFNSVTFLLFFVLMVAIRYSAVSSQLRKLALLLGSYAFYGAWNPLFLPLIWVSSAVDLFVSRRLVAVDEGARHKRRSLLLVSMVANLGLLATFKYLGFAADSLNSLFQTLNIELVVANPEFALPVGISFYTFQTMSYTVDVYRDKTRAAKNATDFLLYVAFFPQLVAGPIVRATDFVPQLDKLQRIRWERVSWGAVLMIIGLFQKLVVADLFMAPIADQVFGADVESALDAWAGTLAFSSQIYMDFAGYSLAAIGAALILGFRLPKNFHSPYGARTFSEFWRRWHISLSSWLRDYLYISLGGNRHGEWMTYRNLALTMVLGGLWHGAAWNFVIWGTLHGVYLALERYFGLAKPPRGLGLNRTFLVLVGVWISWIFFRARTFDDAWSVLSAAFTGSWFTAHIVSNVDLLIAIGGSAAVVAGQIYMRSRSLKSTYLSMPRWLRAAGVAGALLCILLTTSEDRPFIYFQF